MTARIPVSSREARRHNCGVRTTASAEIDSYFSTKIIFVVFDELFLGLVRRGGGGFTTSSLGTFDEDFSLWLDRRRGMDVIPVQIFSSV